VQISYTKVQYKSTNVYWLGSLLQTAMNSRRRGVPSSEPARVERRDFVHYMQEYARNGGLEREIEVVTVESLMEATAPIDEATDFSKALAMAENSLTEKEPEPEPEPEPEEEEYDPGVFVPSRWILDLNTVLYPISRLIIFPGIGQNHLFFRKWGEILQENNIALHSLCLPGRCHRINEKYCLVSDAAEYIVKIIEIYHENYINSETDGNGNSNGNGNENDIKWKKVPTYFYGHCLGALIAFEVAKIFTQQIYTKEHSNNDYTISHLIVSSCKAPDIITKINKDKYGKKWNIQSDSDLMNRCGELGGIPLLLRNKDRRDLLRLMMTTVRKDYYSLEKYIYIPLERKNPHDRGSLDCPITTFGARDDKEAREEEQSPWEEATEYGANPGQYNHNYFFLVGGHTWLNIPTKEKIIQNYILYVCLGVEPSELPNYCQMPSWEDEEGDEEYVREVQIFYG
jgi:surfactin synthase thioesterase subunit